MSDAQGRTVRFEPIEGDSERVLMVETFDLKHPRCPFVMVQLWPEFKVVKPPSDMVGLTRKIPVHKGVSDG